MALGRSPTGRVAAAAAGAGLAALLACATLLGCATAASPAAQAVRVLQKGAATPETPAGPLPEGCRLIGANPSVDRTERELATSDFIPERERAAGAGANLVVARSEMLVPRQNYDCPAASPITDCPPSEGAWYRVVYEDYACSPAALDALPRRRASR
jgi:hypothetical protein